MSKSITAIACAVSLLAGGTAALAGDRVNARGEEQLAKMLEGRVAGEAKRCITTFGAGRGMTAIDGTAFVYRDGGTIWVNRTRNPQAIDDSATAVIERWSGSQLCRTDHVTMVQSGGYITQGIVFLGDFVPYRKAS